MRVLFLCYRGNPFCGGQGIYLYYLTRELAKLGVEIDVLVGPPYPNEMSWARVYKLENLNHFFVKTRDLGYEKLKRTLSFWNFVDYILTRLHVFPEMETFSFRAFFFMRKLLREKKYDLIHDVQCLGWGLLPMKGYGIPIVTTVHHPLTRDRDADFQSSTRTMWDYLTTILFYPLVMQRLVIKRLSRVITSSQEGVEELNRAYGVAAKKISVVYNGLDIDEFRNTGARREENALLFVGNTDDQKKGLVYLLEALNMLPKNIKLTIVDEGPPNKFKTFDIIKRLNLEDRVEFTGKVDIKELVRLYSTKTLLVMSSLYEGFGLPAAEAMSCGMPVVVTDAGALGEVVGKEGIVVPPKDVVALKDAILKMLGDKKLRDRLSKTGKKRVEENFAWPVAARNTLDVYKDVIKNTQR